MAVVAVIPETLAQLTGAVEASAPAWAKDNGAWIKRIIEQHKGFLSEEGIPKLQAAYDGMLDSIDIRDKNRGDDINNKLQVNYAQLIIDTVVDYLTGKPIVWTVEEVEGEQKALMAEYREAIIPLLRKEEAQRVLAEQLRQGSIGGYGCIIAWVNEAGAIDFDEYPLNEIIPVYDTRGRLALVVRYYEVEDQDISGKPITLTRVEVYDEKYVAYYVSTENGEGFELDDTEVETGNPVEHKAGRIPVSIFVNGTPARYEKRRKKNGVSDLANGVLTLLEAYAAGLSDKANYVEYLQDAYLLLKGVDVDEKEVLKMRKARAIALANKESDAEFIAQEQQDDAVEHYLDRLKDTIHDQTQTPKLNDLEGTTATEIRMKYAALDIKAGKKELYFVAAVKQLIAVLTDMLNAKRLTDAGVNDPEALYDMLTGAVKPRVPLYLAEWLQFTINRNLPQNFKEIADIVALLAGKVPDSYLYELLWFIDDPVAALEEMKKQKDEDTKRASTLALGLDNEFAGTE